MTIYGIGYICHIHESYVQIRFNRTFKTFIRYKNYFNSVPIVHGIKCTLFNKNSGRSYSTPTKKGKKKITRDSLFEQQHISRRFSTFLISWRGTRRSFAGLLNAVRIHQLAVLVSPESVEINQNTDEDVALPTAAQILERDPVRLFRLDHVEQLVFDVVKTDRLLVERFQLLLYRAEKIGERKCRQVALVLNVEDFEEVLECLRFFAVFQSEHEVQIGFVVHLAVVGQAFFEEPFDEDAGEDARPVALQFLLAQHSVVVLVEVEILSIDLHRGR